MSIVAAVAASLAVATLGLANAIDMEGTYELDKVEMTKAMAAQMNRQAKGVRQPPGLAVLAMRSYARLEWTIELEAYGQLKMTVTALGSEADERGQSEVTDGTWTTNGESIRLTYRWAGSDTKTINCSGSSVRLTCDPLAKGQPPLVFKKVTAPR
jgi:hypothetical protein